MAEKVVEIEETNELQKQEVEQTVETETKSQIKQVSQVEADNTVKKKKITIMGLSIWRKWKNMRIFFIILGLFSFIFNSIF